MERKVIEFFSVGDFFLVNFINSTVKLTEYNYTESGDELQIKNIKIISLGFISRYQ